MGFTSSSSHCCVVWRWYSGFFVGKHATPARVHAMMKFARILLAVAFIVALISFFVTFPKGSDVSGLDRHLNIYFVVMFSLLILSYFFNKKK